MTNVYFFCPSHKMGGEQMLFIRCAKYLSCIKDYKVFYIDYEDGFSLPYFKDSGIKNVIYHQNRIVELEKKSIVIIALSHIDELKQFFGKRKDIHYLLWSLQPYNLIGKISIMGGRYYSLMKPIRNILGKYVLKLYNRGVIQFMDYNNFFTVHEALSVQIEEINYLQIPIDDDYIIPNYDSSCKSIDCNRINFMWISRIDSDKEPMLLTIMNELNLLAIKKRVKFIVIGDGNSMETVRAYAKKCSFEVDFKGRVSGEDLNRIIDEDVDIGIAMGTSALEMSKRGKPVIMTTTISSVQKAGIINNYILLNQEYGYSLDKPNIFTEGQDCFGNIVEIIIQDYVKCSYLDYDYTRRNHSMNSVGQKLHNLIDRLRMNDPLEDSEILSKIERILRFNKLISINPLRWKV